MTVGELMVHLAGMDKDMPVCGESETSTWDIRASELVPSAGVTIETFEPPDYRTVKRKTYKRALILGYRHR